MELKLENCVLNIFKGQSNSYFAVVIKGSAEYWVVEAQLGHEK